MTVFPINDLALRDCPAPLIAIKYTWNCGAGLLRREQLLLIGVEEWRRYKRSSLRYTGAIKSDRPVLTNFAKARSRRSRRPPNETRLH